MASYNKVQAVGVCMWCISCTFFLLLVAGGLLLALYLVLPESEMTASFPTIGIILVGIPWAFWIVTWFHRLLKGKPAPDGQIPDAGAAAPATAAAAGAGRNDSPVQPGGGATSVLPTIHESDMEEGASSEHSNRNSDARDTSLGSHESERPLALSMS